MDFPAETKEILVVDDDPLIQHVIISALTFSGVQVRSAPSGADALESVTLHPPDLILSDINMPGMNGIELLARLKTQESTRNIPVILISGADEYEAEGLSLGTVDFIYKSFGVDDILTRVRAHL